MDDLLAMVVDGGSMANFNGMFAAAARATVGDGLKQAPPEPAT